MSGMFLCNALERKGKLAILLNLIIGLTYNWFDIYKTYIIKKKYKIHNLKKNLDRFIAAH